MNKIVLSYEAREKLKTAILLEHQDRLPEAVEAYREVVRMEPASVSEWKQIGYLLAKIGESDAAQHAYETALSLDPTCPTTIRNLALIHIKGGNSSEAEALLQEATAGNRKGAGIGPMYLHLSHIYLMQKRWDEAKASLLNAVLAAPVEVGVYYNLAYLYSSLERWDDSLSVCIKLLKIQPNVWDAYLLMYHVLNKTRKNKAADALYKKVVELRSKEDEIKRQWSEVVDQTQNELNIPPFQFELFLPVESKHVA